MKKLTIQELNERYADNFIKTKHRWMYKLPCKFNTWERKEESRLYIHVQNVRIGE